MITKIILPTIIENSLTEYANNVLSNPLLYIDNIRSKKHNGRMIDQYSYKNPGVADQFILNKDLKSIQWNNETLETCFHSKLEYISLPPINVAIPLMKFLEETVGKKIKEPSGNFLYQVGGYMGWHTNSNSPGIRAYVAYCSHDSGSYFKYVDMSSGSPKIITDWDTFGWNVRIFDISDDCDNYLWHCVDSPNAIRISFGYKFK